MHGDFVFQAPEIVHLSHMGKVDLDHDRPLEAGSDYSAKNTPSRFGRVVVQSPTLLHD